MIIAWHCAIWWSITCMKSAPAGMPVTSMKTFSFDKCQVLMSQSRIRPAISAASSRRYEMKTFSTPAMGDLPASQPNARRGCDPPTDNQLQWPTSLHWQTGRVTRECRRYPGLLTVNLPLGEGGQPQDVAVP